MKALWSAWHDFIDRLDARSVRERVLVFLAAVFGLLALLVFGIVSPAMQRSERLSAEVDQLHAQIRQLRAQLAQSPAPAPGRDEAKAGLAAFAAKTAAGPQLAGAVRSLLRLHPGVRLEELSLLPPQPLLSASEPTSKADAPTPLASTTVADADTGSTQAAPVAPSSPDTPAWFAHGIRLELEGGYAELTAAVQGMERLPWLIEWRSLQLDASEHPRIRLRAELAAIHKEAGWHNP